MIETTLDGAVRTVTLARPARRNALNIGGLEALRETIEAAEEPVVAIRGAGEAFCAGADLDTVADVAGDPEAAATLARTGQRTMRAIADSEAIVVAEIDGPARGGGVELSLACDVRVATPEATLAEPGVRLGIFGAWGGTHRLPRVVGRGVAMDLAASGRTVDAEAALQAGLVSRVVGDPRAVTEEIAAGDPAALKAIAALFGDEPDREEAERREVEAFARLAAEAAHDLD